MKVTRIRIPSTFASLDNSGFRHAVADFKLGLGPCGKEVLGLDIARDDSGVTVYQDCAGEEKHFFYPMSQLTGRVETTYGE